jgi:hypothetical protein
MGVRPRPWSVLQHRAGPLSCGGFSLLLAGLPLRCGDPRDDADTVQPERLAELVRPDGTDPFRAVVALVGRGCHGGHHGHHAVLEALAPAHWVDEALVVVDVVEEVGDSGGQLGLSELGPPSHLLDARQRSLGRVDNVGCLYCCGSP